MKSLEFASTDELVRELLSRFDYGVLTAWRAQTDEVDNSVMRWRGHPHTLMGLLQHTSMAIAASIEDVDFSGDDEDEEELLDWADDTSFLDEDDECF